MGRYIIRRLFLSIFTIFFVSVVVFLLTEVSPGNIARMILGQFVTPEQEESFKVQLGLDKPAYLRYIFWLVGSDWYAKKYTGIPFKIVIDKEGYKQWWGVRNDGKLIRWRLEGDNLVALIRNQDGSVKEINKNQKWKNEKNGGRFFWGVDCKNNVVKWEKKSNKVVWTYIYGSGWSKSKGGAVEYIPLRKGFIRGDPGISLLTGRPVVKTLIARFRNSLVLVTLALAIVIPLSLTLGIIAGIREGSLQDRTLSTLGIMFTAVPMFVTGIFLILFFSIWLKWFPGASIFRGESPWANLKMMILPLLTLTLTELGYILRITRASMVETMRSPYIRTAYLKGLPFWWIVIKHAIRNALLAPITVVMYHITWLLGGLVVVETVFGYPGLGKYILDSALYKDVNAIEASVMILVMVTVVAQLLADVIYTFLNPRIHYA